MFKKEILKVIFIKLIFDLKEENFINKMNQLAIHIGAELVIIGGISFYFQKKISHLETEIFLLKEENKQMKQVIQTHGMYLHQILNGGRKPKSSYDQTDEDLDEQLQEELSELTTEEEDEDENECEGEVCRVQEISSKDMEDKINGATKKR